MRGMFYRMIRFLWPVSLLILLDGCERKEAETTGDVMPEPKAGVVDLLFT